MEEVNDLIKILKEHWQYKQQLAKLAKADLVKTYRGRKRCKWLSFFPLAYLWIDSMVLHKRYANYWN